MFLYVFLRGGYVNVYSNSLDIFCQLSRKRANECVQSCTQLGLNMYSL